MTDAPKKSESRGHLSLAEVIGLARAAWTAGDFDTALERAEAAVAAYSSYPQGYLVMAQSLAALNRIDESLVALRRGIAVHPGNLKLLGAIRSIASMYGRFEDAMESAQKLLELGPEDPKNHVLLFMCYIGAGKIDLASKHLTALNGMEKWPSVAKLANYLHDYHRLSKSYPVLVSAWESCLRTSNGKNYPEPNAVEKIPIIQYWSQGTPPDDVAQIVSRWNALLGAGGLSQVSLFNRDSALNWINSYAPEFAHAFTGAFHFAMESDIFRIAYASRRPCIYIDIDSWPLEHTVQILKFGIQTGSSMLYFRSYRPWVANGFFIARPDCHFFSELVRQCREIDSSSMPKNHATIEGTFGPSRYNNVLYKLLRERKHVRETNAVSPKGCSAIKFSDSMICFTHEAAVASVKPPFPLGYKTTEDYWKGHR